MGKVKDNLMFKMTLMTCVLVLLVVAGIGGISYYWSSKAVTFEVESKLKAELESVQAKFELKLTNTQDILELIGQTPALKNLQASDFEATSRLADSDRKNLAVHLLENVLKKRADLFESIFIADKNGQIVLDGKGGEAIGISIADRDYYDKALSGQTVWSDIVSSKSTGEPVTIFAYPLKNKSGQTTGILATAVKMESFFEVLANLKVGQHGYAYMVDKNGLFVYHPDKAIMMQKNISDLGIGPLSQAKEAMVTGQDGKVIYTYDGVRKLNIFTGMNGYSISLNADESEYLSSLNDMRDRMLIFGVVFFLIGAGVAGAIANYIVKRIRRMQEVMRLAAEGDLRSEFRVNEARPASGDEVIQMGISLNEMIDSFRDMILQITKTAESLSSSSQQLASSAEEGGQSAEEVTSNIEEITAGSEEQSNYVISTKEVVLDMKVQLDKSAEATDQMVDESLQVMETARNGQEQMKVTIGKMDAIRSSSEQTIQVINALNEQSSRIGQISETISDIADQTNLLALNASIEAARAGEQGRGFAVVAEEIRQLATESMESATGIKALISEIQSEITMANRLINTENGAIHEGIKTIDQTGEAFNDITSRIESTNTLIGRVAQAIESTEVYGNRVTEAMEFIATVSQQTTASAQEVSASAEEQNAISEEIAGASDQLSSMAQELLSRVTRFKV